MPLEWEESDPRYIANAADVKLRAFSTKVCEGGGGGGGGTGHLVCRQQGLASTYPHSTTHATPNAPRPSPCQVHNVEALVSYKQDADELF